MNGWMLYSRVAPFLDCAQTTVDDDHPALCQTTPASQRYGPLYYSWEPASPARTEFGLSPDASGYLLRLGLDAIRHQPVSYAKAVATDAVRVFFWSFHSKPGHGQILGVYDFEYRDRAWEEMLAQALDAPYDGVYVNAGSVRVLHDYQMLTRVRGWMMLAMFLIGVAGLFVARRGTRGSPMFVLAVVIGLWFLPILTFTWDFRYTLPGTAFLPLAALLAIPAWTRRREWPPAAVGAEAVASGEASIDGVEGAAGDAEPLSAR
jgi:hypothetical protein